jgi:DNA repair protein RecN (Recombination protein N)
MLASLRIQNLALVDDLSWSIEPGFSAITGETGAGKSIIIGALKLLLGERADRSLIRSGAETCAVEAVFTIENSADLNQQLVEQGIDPCSDSTLIIKRVITRSGSSKQFVNCCATTLAVMKEIGDALVDLHGPHDHQSLLSTSYQLQLLDAFAGADTCRDTCNELFRTAARLSKEYQELTATAIERELDLLKHQVGEIDAAQLREEEEETLFARYSAAKNSRRLNEVAGQILQRLVEADDAVTARLAEIQRLFREMEKLDPRSAELAQSHATVVTQLEDVARSLENHITDLQLDPAQLEELEQRVTLLENLKRKYGGSIAEVIASGQAAAERLHKLEHRGEEISRLQDQMVKTAAQLKIAAAELSSKRQRAAPALAKAIKAELTNLGFKQSDFEIRLLQLVEPGSNGAEEIEFVFAPNPGEPLSPFRATASSGEISRVMLAVKSAVATQDRIPILVFDEIDANVGGEIAGAVGFKMRLLGEKHQVLCITHLPQVAAAATAQFVVTKEFVKERTTSRLDPVSGKERVEEIARMLGGKSSSALAHARQLLEQQT